MKFKCLKVANYRGLENCEVNFGSSGITLVQGPNEAGKTSLSEAIWILFEYLDSSTSASVKAIRPVHRDVGPEIELTAESGPYAFSYFKRFYKKPETKLNITRPKPENYTGREAHERAKAILSETLDIDLWKALAVQQGDKIHQPDLSDQTSLSAALDLVAGGHPANTQEEGLYDRVKDEYNLYFTERGAEKKGFLEERNKQIKTREEIGKIEHEISGLERDIERFEALKKSLERLMNQKEEQEEILSVHKATLEKIAELDNKIISAKLKLESAQKTMHTEHRDLEDRMNLIHKVDKAEKEHGELIESSLTSSSNLNKAEDEFKKAQQAYQEVDNKRKKAEALALLRRADEEYYNNKLHLEQLQERKNRIDQAREDAANAEEVLGLNKTDSDAMNAIRGLEKKLLVAEAQLQTEAPSVLLRGLAECSLQINSEDILLGKDEVRNLPPVEEKVILTIPRTLDIEITSGSSTDHLKYKVADARHALESACEAAGIKNPDEARAAFAERQEAERLIVAMQQVEEENRRDLDYEELDRKLRGLQKGVPSYLSQRQKMPAICTDLKSAKKERIVAEESQQKVNDKWEAARVAIEATRKTQDESRSKYQEVKVMLDLFAKDLKGERDNLEQARKSVPDDILKVNLVKATEVVTAEEAKVEAAEKSLSAKNPEQVRALEETAKGSLQTTRKQRADAQTELTEVQTRLEIRGEEGLHEKLHAAQSRLKHIENHNRALFRRAAAAKLLYETMREERDHARLAYVAPLKESIERLSRLVFEESIQIEINERLQIVSRTLNGITVPFDSLSGGTREQLSLIFRLACSMIAATEGGTPIILDDALGYTDPERLQLMGAVLAKVAKECQIVIFTCLPDRYSNIGEARVVRLG